jgi:hypothetical protein
MSVVFERASSGLSVVAGNWIGLPFFVSDDNVSMSGRGGPSRSSYG